MGLSLNNVQVAGNLTRTPELKQLANDNTVASFGLAINRKYRSKGGDMVEEVTFVDIEAWGRQAELCGQYLEKGRNCLIEGSLKLETWDDAATGAKRSKMKIVAHRVHFIGGQQEQGAGRSQQPHTPPAAPQQPAPALEPGYDELEPPF